MRLADPLFLLFAIMPLIFFFFRKKNSIFLVNSFSIPKGIQAFDLEKLLRLLKLVGALLIIIAFARPQSSSRETERNINGIDIMMLLDVSASMNAEDMSETASRLDVAKSTMESFIKGRENDRIGFVIFSGEPLTLSPPTLDYGLVLQALRKIELGILKDGTAIGDGLALAVNRLRGSKAKSRVIVLLTDGDSNIGQVDPLTAGDLAYGYGVKVYSIAIGREGRIRLPIRRKTFTGDIVTSYQWMDNALNPQLLQQISEKTKGKFYRVQDLETLKSVFKEIDQLEKTDQSVKEKIHYEEKYFSFLFLGLICLLLESILRRVVWRVLA